MVRPAMVGEIAGATIGNLSGVSAVDMVDRVGSEGSDGPGGPDRQPDDNAASGNCHVKDVGIADMARSP